MSLKQIEDRVYDLISQKMSGDADGASLRELNDLLKKYPQFRFLDDQLTKMNSSEGEGNSSFTDQAYAAHYVKMLYANKERLENPPIENEIASTRRSTTKKYLVACMSVVAVIAAIFFYNDIKKPVSTEGDSSIVAADTRSKVVLPDGTTVFLNIGSKIDYDKGFNGKERKVILTGEAYFDVAHNPAKPFIVHTSTADIRVYGTQFNVKNYDEEVWETTLLTGKVEVLVNNAAKERFILKPSQKLSIPKQDESVNKYAKELKRTEEKIIISQYTTLQSQVAETSWMEDKMVFVNKPLYEIATELERQFHITVSFNSEKTKLYRYTGGFSNQSLTEVLQILDISRPIKYRLENNHLQID
jgi:ferric-dicitrate binding protein FerR (iron transport regulator)